MDPLSPTKSSNALTPTRPRTRSVSSRGTFRDLETSLSLRSDQLAFERNFDALSYVDGNSKYSFVLMTINTRFSISGN